MHLDLNALEVPVFVTDVESGAGFRVVAMNTAAEREFGFLNSRVAGRLFHECFGERIANSLKERYAICVRTKVAQQFEEFGDLPKGKQWFRTTLSPCLSPDTGEVVRIMSVSQNITSIKRAHDRLREFAFLDPLTGLPNRRGFDQAVEDICNEAVYSGRGFSVAVVDVDELKSINDTYGHRLGDQVIKFVGSTLRDFVRPQEIAARVGGDEFFLILRAATRPMLDERLDALRVAVGKGLRMAGFTRPLALSVGGSVWYPGDDAHEALSMADAEMYVEKGIHRLVRLAERSVRPSNDIREAV